MGGGNRVNFFFWGRVESAGWPIGLGFRSLWLAFALPSRKSASRPRGLICQAEKKKKRKPKKLSRGGGLFVFVFFFYPATQFSPSCPLFLLGGERILGGGGRLFSAFFSLAPRARAGLRIYPARLPALPHPALEQVGPEKKKIPPHTEFHTGGKVSERNPC